MQHLYEFEPDNPDLRAHPYPKVLSDQVYSGDFSIRLGAARDTIEFTRGLCRTVPIFSYRSRVDTALRRSYKHIRQSDRQSYAIWLLRKGAIRISTSGGTRTIPEGSIAITDSSSPFLAEALVGEAGGNEHRLVVLPSHMLHAHLSGAPEVNGMSFSAACSDGEVVGSLVDLLFRAHLDEASSCELVQASLRALGRMIAAKLGEAAHRPSLREARLQSILALIDLELSNANLTLADVARRCQISERYLCKLMLDTGQTFAAALRSKRMAMAREWLLSPEKRRCSIGEIGQLAGFSSSSQFSRSFREHYGCTARELRSAGQHPFAASGTA